MNNNIINRIGSLFNRNVSTYKNVKSYCFFIGYPRSGHTLYGALLDAHPNCIISHELNVLNLIKNKNSKNQIFNKIVSNSKLHASEGRKNEGYKYEVKNQWQGKINELNVIGDKQGGRSSLMLSEEPDLLQKLSDKLGDIPIKILHVYRNPFDNIASRSKGGNLQKKEFSLKILKKDIERHFIQADVNSKIRKDGKYEVLDIKHEDFISWPKKGLINICEFLGLEPNEQYINDCASIVFQKPHKTRFDIEFPEDLKIRIDKKIKEYDFLAGYSFDD